MEIYESRYHRKERIFSASNNYGSQIYYLHQSNESLLNQLHKKDLEIKELEEVCHNYFDCGRKEYENLYNA